MVGGQILLKQLVILNYTIMDKGDSSLLISMWVSINISLGAMCSPSSVCDSKVAFVKSFRLKSKFLKAITAIPGLLCVLSNYDSLGLVVQRCDTA